MSKSQIAIFASVAIVVAGALVYTMRTNQSTSTTDGQGVIGVRPSIVTEITPYTHTVSIPGTVDPSTIRLEKLKAVELASKTETVTDPKDCNERQFRDPDGTNCQSIKVLERVKAVEADYSYVGPELASGDSNNPGRQSFAVYFRPEEVDVDGPVGKLKREQASALFQVNTSHPMTEQKVVDKQHSRYCDGKYEDGRWLQSDANCRDQVQYISQTVAASNWTVQVDLRHPAVAHR